jgi:uncharacterized membrane protein YqiK
MFELIANFILKYLSVIGIVLGIVGIFYWWWVDKKYKEQIRNEAMFDEANKDDNDDEPRFI